jgi:outer membrane protein assembly factor BamB
VFTTLYDGRVVAYSTADGSQVWSATLPAGTNSPLVIAGDRLVTAAGVPHGPDQKAALVVFELNGTPATPLSPPPGSPSPNPSQSPNASPTPPSVITP